MLRRLPTAAHLSQPGRDLCHEAQPRLRQDQALPVLVPVLVLVPVPVPVLVLVLMVPMASLVPELLIGGHRRAS